MDKVQDDEYFSNVVNEGNDDFIPEDKREKEFVGIAAVNSYYKHYKNLNRIT